MPVAKTEKLVIEFPTQLRVPEKLAMLADKRGQSISVVLRHLIDDALSEYGMTLYDGRVRRGNSLMGAANEGSVPLKVKLTDSENDMVLQAAQENDTYGAADYIALILDRDYDKYELRNAYQEYTKLEKQRREAKVTRCNSIVLHMNPRRYERYKKRAEEALNGSLNDYILTILYLNNRKEA